MALFLTHGNSNMYQKVKGFTFVTDALFEYNLASR